MPKPKARTKTAVKPTPWWLGTGDVVCPHCGQPYFHEHEFRCPDCDEPSCRNCKCPQCHAKSHASEREEQAHGR